VKYTQGIPGASPTTQCFKAPTASFFDFLSSVFTTHLSPVLMFFAEPAAPLPAYGLTANPRNIDFASVSLNTQTASQQTLTGNGVFSFPPCSGRAAERFLHPASSRWHQ